MVTINIDGMWTSLSTAFALFPMPRRSSAQYRNRASFCVANRWSWRWISASVTASAAETLRVYIIRLFTLEYQERGDRELSSLGRGAVLTPDWSTRFDAFTEPFRASASLDSGRPTVAAGALGNQGFLGDFGVTATPAYAWPCRERRPYPLRMILVSS